MNKENKKYKLNYLSAEFYKQYSTDRYPEIENKENRPYMVLLIKVDSNTFAIPFRTNVKHNNCYKFQNSTRPTESVTGLDYSKAVVINDSIFIGKAARINDDEYTELDMNYHIIIKRFTTYVRGYIKYAEGTLNEYQRFKYRYTTLQYFHKELGIKQ
ncbi:MAG: hypothetical protein HDR18_12390 [Lachnospiraceae bacterium]|nr:hypothetical protein [Lachnospiraceae bacterium]MBD5486297.1 hypothetical protein [Lachnospiraceae bacterium]